MSIEQTPPNLENDGIESDVERVSADFDRIHALCEILSPAKYKKQMDYAVMYELAEKNRDFSQFLTTITEYDHKNPHRYLSEFDKVKSDAEMADYLAEKGILPDGKAEAA